MGIVLGANHYGKAETRLFRIIRDTPRHEVRDLNVSTSLSGDFADAHLTGDQANVLPTDTQKNTFRRSGAEVRTTRVTVGPEGARVDSGARDLVLLKSTGSEFAGFLVDDYTTLPPTHDRVLATSLTATWSYSAAAAERGVDWASAYDAVRGALLDRFANVHSLALQQSLWEMGRAALEAQPDVCSIELVAPNIHHIAVDLSPFGLDNPGEVFHVTDRPYGLIEVTVQRDGGD
jgi:urate oxidase